MMKRLIGEYGEYNSGPLFIVLAGIHGNEKAGIFALEKIFEYLSLNKISFKGKLIALRGNLTALKLDQRFIHKDLNRQWYDSKIKKLSALPFGMLNTAEDREQVQLLDYIQYILTQHDDKEDILMVDLHTTSAAGACMTITNDSNKSVAYARMLPVPVISGMTSILEGTTLEYFEDMGIPGIAYEAGQHDDIESIERMKYGLMSLFLNAKIIDENQNKFFKEGIERLRKYNEGLPYVVDVIYHHAIVEEDNFVMKPGYSNFKTITKGEYLADDVSGKVLAPNDGMILMPLYQKKGNDGFFIVEKQVE